MSISHSVADLPPRGPISWGVKALGCLGVCVLVVAMAAASIWLYFRGKHQQAIREVNAEVARIHAAGEPITVDDMVKFYRIPDGEFDATPLWLEALHSAAAIKDPDEQKLPFVGEGEVADLRADAPQSLLSLAEKFLAAHAETIAKTRQAAAAGGQCRYPIEFADGILALQPHIGEMFELRPILSLRLHVAVVQGDVDAAIESLHLELALAETLEHEPSLISQLMRTRALEMAFHHVRSLVSDLPLSEPQLADLQRRLEAIGIRQPIKVGLLGERATGFHTFHHLAGTDTFSWEKESLERPGDLRVYLEMMREMIEAADKPPAQARLVAQRVEDRLKQLGASINPLDRWEIVVTGQFLPATGSTFDVSARLLAQRDASAAGIALRRYQLKHGDAPTSLEALVPEFLPAVPTDPFIVSKPLALVFEGDQFAIYSVGVNLKDDRALFRNAHTIEDVGFVARLKVPEVGESSALPAGGAK